MRCRDNRHILAWAAEPGIQFIALMHPDFGQAIRDGVSLTNRDLKWRAPAMATGRSGSRIRNQLAVPVIPERPALLGSAAPTSQAHHFVEGDPVGERVVGCMHADDATA